MAGDPTKEQAVAREEVMKCEREIQSIKAALRRLGDAGNEDNPNSLDIVLLKVILEGFHTSHDIYILSDHLTQYAILASG